MQINKFCQLRLAEIDDFKSPALVQDAAFYFGLEEYLLQKKAADISYFFLWRCRPTVMLGKYQQAFKEVNLDYCRQKGVDLLRRKSGGGAIYTDPACWQFSYISPISGVELDFKTFTDAILEALLALGLKVEYNGRNDLICCGKKFSGNAQYKESGLTVHHGTLLVATELEELSNCLRVQDYKLKSKGIDSVRERVMNLSEQGEVSPEALIQGVRESFQERGYSWSEQSLTAADIAAANHFADLLFRNEERVWSENPEFTRTLNFRFSGGEVILELLVKRGEIQDLSFTGDFFHLQDLAPLKAKLIGCKYERQDFYDRLCEIELERYIAGLKAKELAALLPEI
ncbi:MAG: lipoate--protein ligase [Eubacteriales bacterium]|nr:lipoate--protein ligase [Eubacteriales bacterium]